MIAIQKSVPFKLTDLIKYLIILSGLRGARCVISERTSGFIGALRTTSPTRFCGSDVRVLDTVHVKRIKALIRQTL